jgi:hypothetical protein
MFGGVIAAIGDLALAGALGVAAATGEAMIARPATASKKADERMI